MQQKPNSFFLCLAKLVCFCCFFFFSHLFNILSKTDELEITTGLISFKHKVSIIAVLLNKVFFAVVHRSIKNTLDCLFSVRNRQVIQKQKKT